MQSKFANKISKVQIFNHNFNNYDKSQIGIKNKIWIKISKIDRKI